MSRSGLTSVGVGENCLKISGCELKKSGNRWKWAAMNSSEWVAVDWGG